jgi:hypothetical protein
MSEEMEEMAEAAFVEEAAPEVEETAAQHDERLKREDYARRNAQAIKEREDILRRNNVLKPGEALTMDTEAAIRQRCCA